MKKLFASVLCLMIFLTSSASANPFAVPAKPAASWSLSDAMELVGEDVFAEMLTELKQNLISGLGKDSGIGVTYSPGLYALIDSLTADHISPHEAVYSIGDDTSPDMIACFTVLKNKGYLDEIPSSYTEEVANEVRKIQYAAGLPATGEITNALSSALLIESIIPSNAETLSCLAPISGLIADQCTREMNTALYISSLVSQDSRGNPDFLANAAAAATGSYLQAREYLPSFAVRYQFYKPVTSIWAAMNDSENAAEIDDEALSIISNSSALLSVLFYYAQYDLKHDFTGYAVEYAELLKK